MIRWSSMTVAEAKIIHCIGIGGIGVSALAALWRAQGKQVSGSDATESEIITGLQAQGIDVYIGLRSTSYALRPDLIIYSDAVPEDHSERVAARAAGIPELSYAQALGQASRQYRTIVVTGTHGKSTTTALLGLMLEAAGFDPLVIVGSKVPGWPLGNLRLPTTTSYLLPTTYFVVEGDDYRDHFLELQPYGVVVTSIEWDHPDYFRDLAHTVESFVRLVEKVPDDGLVVLNQDDTGCQLLHSAIPQNRRMMTYGKGSKIFDQLHPQVPGVFNRYNATAAATAALVLGVPREIAEKVVREFKGIWRRFEMVGEYAGATIISDYGHHPTAIRETMKAARQAYPGRRLVLVYQPHQHSRTKRLFNDFVEALKDAADVVILSEIYAVKGRMEDRGVSSQMLVDAITQMPTAADHADKMVRYGGDLVYTKEILFRNVQAGDIVIFMGAGDIDNLARELVHTQ